MAIKMKRSAVAAKAPGTSDLALGEIAVNTNDGKLYLKKNDGTDAIVEVGPVLSVAAKTGIITLEQADVSGLEAALSGKQDTSAKGQANGYAGLDGTGKVPEAQLPATLITEALTQAQAENPASTVFGTVSGERLGQHTDDAFNVTGSAPKYACRAWVNFDGTGTVAIRESGNVSSITDDGTGRYTINFTTAMPDANYSIVGMTEQSNLGDGGDKDGLHTLGIVSTLSTSVSITSDNWNPYDYEVERRDVSVICVSIFR